MIKTNKTTAGFTLLEFLAVMVLVAVLVTIAIPIYNTYVIKARFQNVIQAAVAYEVPVAVCIQSQGLASVGTGTTAITNTACPNEIPSGDVTTGLPTFVSKVNVSGAGVIVATAAAGNGLTTSDTYTLTPTLTVTTGNTIVWAGACSPTKYC